MENLEINTRENFYEKIILLPLVIAILGLSGCNNAASSKTKVQLSMENYAKYIAIQTVSDDTEYRYYFIGSNIAKYTDCYVEYNFTDQNNYGYSDNYTATLNISGYGQTVEALRNSTGSRYILHIVNVIGTVEVLY